MNSQERYYNDFYLKMSEMDEASNSFDKIGGIIPDLPVGSEIIDIGCGHGGVSSELVRRGFFVTGIEINDDALLSMKSRGITPLRRDINKPLDVDKSFDVALLLDVLEHVFDPVSLLAEVKRIVKPGGFIVVSVPLYFDILDRIKILFTGSVISVDNLVYGKDIYNKFRSFNYDHIRFFRHQDLIEMGALLGLEVKLVEYGATALPGAGFPLGLLIRCFSNKYTVKLFPGVLAHSMKILWRVP